MAWLQFSVTLAQGRTGPVEALFEGLGALSVTYGDAGDEPVLEPDPGETRLWSRTRVTALFEADQDPEALAQRIRAGLPPDLIPSLTLEHLEDRVWERVWLEEFHPMRFGRRLWVCPAGQRPDQPDALILELDPGLAFGTGTHPTTALCLAWLDGQQVAGKRVLDYGCGSGILAVAAALLGAKSVIAVDHDPQALEATLDNARKNGVEDRIRIYSPAADPGDAADILLANILAGTLVDLAPRLAPRVANGGRIALSGILADQAERVADAYRPWYRIDPPQRQEEWILLQGRRGSS